MSGIKIDTEELERIREIKLVGEQIKKYSKNLDKFYEKIKSKYKGNALVEFKASAEQVHQLELLGDLYIAIADGMKNVSRGIDEADTQLAKEN